MKKKSTKSIPLTKSGQSTVEVGLILTLIMVVALVGLAGIRRQVWCSIAKAAEGIAQAMGAYTIDVTGNGTADNLDLFRINMCLPPN